MSERQRVVPATLRWAVWLLYVEALAATALTGFLLYESVTQKAVSVGSAATVVAFMAGMAALLWFLGTALSRRKSPARAPAIVLELLFLPIGYYVVEGGLPVLGIPLMAAGFACSVLLFAPSTRGFLGIH